MAGIYVHVPFCKQKCTYCDFASYPREIQKAEAYFACLYKEIKSRSMELKDKFFDTVYFGGGTPSFVDPKYILGAMRLIKKTFNLSPDLEVTLEVNPGTIDRSKLRIYKEAGINRFSIGLQTADDQMLKKLNRIHTKEDFLKAADVLKGYNLSVDIMLGIFDQGKDKVKESIDLAILGGAKHISAYALKAEEGTPLYSNYLNGDLPDDDTVAELYDFARQYLKENGFDRYEVSNFAKDGYQSRHNLNYWRRGEYIGFGVAASSCINDRRFTNTERLDEYIHCLLHDRYAEVSSELIEGKERKFEYAMLALRTASGINFDQYKKVFGSDFYTDFKSKLAPVIKYFDVDAKGIKIKDEYLYVQNNIIIHLMD